VGVSHECDHPADVVGLPILTAPKLDPGKPRRDIDNDIRALVSAGLGVYAIDTARLAELELPPAQGGLGSPPARDAPTDGESRERERQEAGQIEEPREQRIVHLDQPRHDQRGEQSGQESRADTAEPGGGDYARLEEPGWMNQRHHLRTDWNRSDERYLERRDEGDTEGGQRIPQGRGLKTFPHGCAAVSGPPGCCQPRSLSHRRRQRDQAQS